MTQTPGPKVSAGGITKIVRASLTRPNNATVYTAGFVFANSTTQANPIVFSNCARYPGGSGLIQFVGLTDSTNQTLKLDADLFLFSAIMPDAALGNDGAVFTPTMAQQAYRIACIQLPSANVRVANGAGAGASGNSVNDIGNLAIPFMCEDNDENIYGVLVARNAYIPIALSTIVLKLGVLQD